MSKFDDLPRLYRVVSCKIEYVHDYCVNGEHDQRCGDYWIQARRVIDEELGWKWVPLNDGCFDSYENFAQREILDWLEECSGDLGCMLDWAVGQINLPTSWKEPDGYN